MEKKNVIKIITSHSLIIWKFQGDKLMKDNFLLLFVEILLRLFICFNNKQYVNNIIRILYTYWHSR